MAKSLKIRIESTGAGVREFKVYDADTGEEIQNVFGISFDIDAGNSYPTVTLRLGDMPEMDFEAHAYIEKKELEPELTKEEKSAKAYEKSKGLVGKPLERSA